MLYDTDFPFIPKSNRYLIPGQFWSIPLPDGTFGCGRVIQLPNDNSRVSFLAGLMRWRSTFPPTSDTIAMCECIAQGGAHIKTILENGGSITGFRPLSIDNIEPWLFRGAEHFKNSHVYRGLHPVRKQTQDDDHLPVRTGWGFKVIYIEALKIPVQHS